MRNLRLCKRLTSILLVGLLSICGCVSKIPTQPALRVGVNPFVSELGMLGEIVEPGKRPSTLCVDHVSDGIGFPEEDERVGNFEALLREELQAAGFAIVDGVALNETWKRVVEESDGVYDPHTGRVDSKRYEARHAVALKALGDDNDCDFLVVPSIVLVSAAWLGGLVQWDGATYRFGKGINPGGGAYGHLTALSLHIRIADLEGELVYFGTGGIELTSELEGGFWKDSYNAVDTDVYLTKVDRNREAIRLATRSMRLPGPDPVGN